MHDSPEQHHLIVEVWRAATSASALDECADRFAALLAPSLPGDTLTIWRMARDGSELNGTATASMQRGARVTPLRRHLSTRDVDTLQLLRARPSPRSVRNAKDSAEARLFAPDGDCRHLLIAPLVEGDRLAGALVIIRRQGAPFDAEHLALAEELAPPFAAAIRLDDEREQEQRRREALEADRRALLQRLDRDDVASVVVGRESGLRDVMLRVEQVAPTDAPVLLLGETGSGKEVVARAIHSHSRRAQGPVVRVNCGAIPAGLIDSELFGHEKGSFTGATSTRKGWFERADGGTLFLDEVAELPLDAQVRLLRILQDGVFERVGAQRPLRVDVRIVAATHRDLRDMVARRTFREDLWYRLSVFPIEIPPLRARIEDIPALASHFAARAGARLGGAPLVLSAHDVELLIAYDWPGNVRELAAVVERAAILGDGKRLRLEAALGTGESRPRTASREEPFAPGRDDDPSAILPLDQAMARHIERALRATRGRIEGKGGAAELLRINPHTLRARMRKLGIDWGEIRAASRDNPVDHIA